MFVVGCGTPIKDGTIVYKEFSPQHEEITLVYDFFTESFKPDYITIPNRWFIIIEKLDESNNKVQRTIQISKETYDSIEIGKYYDSRN